MKRLLFVLMLMITIESLALAQNTSLMLMYQGHKATKGIPVYEIPLLKDEILECIPNGYMPIVIEGNYEIAWIYLNTVDDPRDYVGEDFDEIETSYIELYNDLFPIRINETLKELLTRKRYGGFKKFFKTIGVRYSNDDNGEIITKINYDKFEPFVFGY